jgi:hypothetical protein
MSSDGSRFFSLICPVVQSEDDFEGRKVEAIVQAKSNFLAQNGQKDDRLQIGNTQIASRASALLGSRQSPFSMGKEDSAQQVRQTDNVPYSALSLPKTVSNPLFVQ